MAEITETGYQGKTVNEYYDEEKKRYIDIDPKWNLDVSTPDGLKLATDSEIWATLDALGQQCYNSKDPAKATGLQLDTLAYLTTGKPRKIGTASSVVLKLEGVDGTIVNKDSEFKSTIDGTIWKTILKATIDSTGEVLVSATCTTLGAVDASAGDITNIVSPVAGLSSATNPDSAVPGENPETDTQLRERRQRSVATTGSNQADNMYSVIATLPSVGEVKIYENFSNTTDANNVAAHSLGIIVSGGDNQAIADAIYSKKNPGCGLSFLGADAAYHVTQSVTSPVTNNQMNISFSRPEPVTIYLTANISDDGTLPTDADVLISKAIVDYTRGATEYTLGFRKNGFNIGDDVIFSSLYTPVNQILGSFGASFVTSITIGKASGSQAAANIVIAPFELSVFSELTNSIVIT